MSEYIIIEIVVPNVKVSNINVYFTGPYPNRDHLLEYRATLTDSDVEGLISKLNDNTILSPIDTSNTRISNRTIKGKFDPDIWIYQPKVIDEKLVRERTLLKSIPDVYSVHLRGIFNMIVVAAIERTFEDNILLSFTIKNAKLTDEYMRYIGDEVFPDWVVPDDSNVSYDEVYKFTDSY